MNNSYRIAERKERRAKREKASTIPAKAVLEDIACPSPCNEDGNTPRQCERDLEKRLDNLIVQYRRYVHPGPRLFLNDLCRQVAVWQEEMPSRQRELDTVRLKSPLHVTREYVQCLHDDFYALQDEYLYITRDHNGVDWQKRRKRLHDTTSRLALFLDMVDDIQRAVDRDELRDRLITKTLNYFTMYSHALSYW
ncbi:hypothetical protein AAF712_015544 [Marasmius tenuissimus]|uniref:Uncharacterized protein n=1 Tax=Marasmius tenuissimus TaxID=585030 RepID=A0ABR2Z803_9AGAR